MKALSILLLLSSFLLAGCAGVTAHTDDLGLLSGNSRLAGKTMTCVLDKQTVAWYSSVVDNYCFDQDGNVLYVVGQQQDLMGFSSLLAVIAGFGLGRL